MKRRVHPWQVLTLVILASLLAGTLLFASLRDAVKRSVENDLSSLAILKSEQINEWIDDHHSDAKSLGVDSFFSQAVQNWLASGKSDDQQRARLHSHLQRFVDAHHFTSVLLYDIDGQPLLAAGEKVHDQKRMRAEALSAIASGKIEFIDLHRHEHEDSQPEVGVVSPLAVAGRIIGAIYFVEDASRYLYPLLQQWSKDSQTVETQLVRAEGDRVLFLSPLRHRAVAPLTFSLPLNTPGLGAAAVLRGRVGLLPHSHDYRGHEVLSFAVPIEGTAWVMVAKMDEDEAYALLNRMQHIAILFALILLAATTGWFWQWQRRQKLSYQAEELQIQLQADASLLESEKRFRIVFEQAALAMVRNALSGEAIEVNDAWCAMFGYSREEALTLPVSWQSTTHPDDLQASESKLTQLLSGEIEAIRTQKRYLHKDGKIIWGSTEVSLVRDAQGKPEYFIYAIQDITGRRQLADELERNRDLLKMALDSAQEAVWEWDVASGETKFSPEFYTMLGYLPDEFPADQHGWLSRIHPEDRDAVKAKVRDELSQHNQDVFVAEYRMLNKDGRYRWLQVRGKCVAFDAHGKPLKMVGIHMDINEHKQAELQVNYLAYHDKLTGLPNRALLFDRFSQAISQARRDKLQVALLFADLDGFKQVNDQLGHEAGDMVLKMTAQRLLGCVRAVDTAVRLGGDEFAVVLGGLDDASQAALVAEKIVKAFAAEMVLPDGRICRVGVSIGISLFPENGSTMDGLLTAADQAMYASKRKGKNTYTLFGGDAEVEQAQWLRFDDSMLLGIAELDEQHRNLTRMVNKLNSAWRHGQSHQALLELFDQLVTLVAGHFETEARHMAQGAYPELRQHEKEHAMLLDEIMRLRKRLNEGGELFVLQTLKDWLLGHILRSDKHMADYLLSKGLH